MIIIRKAADRGHTGLDWLDSWHTFSFAEYYDPDHMGFRALRVINEDRVQPSKGFGFHSHRDMEIISIVIEGALEHRDDMGNGAVIRPGEIQHLSAGTGITHSEFNHSASETVHFLQIWVLPTSKGAEPGYEQKSFSEKEKRGSLRVVASPDGRDGSLKIRQNALIFASMLMQSEAVTHRISDDRHVWVQVVRGKITLNGLELDAGDGAAVSEEDEVNIMGKTTSELLLFDLA